MDTYQTEFSDNRPEEKTWIKIEQLLSEFTFWRSLSGQCVDNLDGVRETILDLEPGVSPGTSGMKNEYLISLAEVWSAE